VFETILICANPKAGFFVKIFINFPGAQKKFTIFIFSK